MIASLENLRDSTGNQLELMKIVYPVRYKVNTQANTIYDKIVIYELNVQMTSPRKGEEKKLIENSSTAG